MADIFISYKSERRPAARYLSKCLKLYGFSSWYDYGLLPGEDFEQRLMGELQQARVCVVLWCSLSVQSNWVSKEVSKAHERGILLPCSIQRCSIPEPYSRLDTIQLSDWDGAPRGHALDRLLAEVGRRLGVSPRPDFEGLRELDEDWRALGAPALANFGLGEAIPSMLERSPENRGEKDVPDLVGCYIKLTGVDNEFWLFPGGVAQWRPYGFLEFQERKLGTWEFDGVTLTVQRGAEWPKIDYFEMELKGDRLFGKLVRRGFGDLSDRDTPVSGVIRRA